MIITAISAIVFAGFFLLAFYGAVMLASKLVDNGPIERIRAWNLRRRKLGTPPCSKCGRGCFSYGVWYCDCPEFKDFTEHVLVRRLTSVPATDVRGTKWCRYEQKPEEKPEEGEGI